MVSFFRRGRSQLQNMKQINSIKLNTRIRISLANTLPSDESEINDELNNKNGLCPGSRRQGFLNLQIFCMKMKDKSINVLF